MHRGSRITLASDPDKSRHGRSSYYLINNFLTVDPKMAIILPTGQWYAPSVVIYNALITH